MLMSNVDEKILRKQLIDEIKKLDHEKLMIVHQFLAQLIGDELVDEITKDWESGKVNRKMIKKAIDEHRKLHPYSKTK